MNPHEDKVEVDNLDLNLMGIDYYKDKQMNKAAHYFTQALKHSSNEDEFILILENNYCCALLRMGQLDEALSKLQNIYNQAKEQFFDSRLYSC